VNDDNDDDGNRNNNIIFSYCLDLCVSNTIGFLIIFIHQNGREHKKEKNTVITGIALTGSNV